MIDAANEPSDSEAIRQTLDGNVNAFELLIERYQGHVGRIVVKHVPPDRIEEVAHETFVRAFQSLGSFEERRPFAHWLSIIAVRCCHDFWREEYRNRETPASAMSDDCQGWLERLLFDQSEAFFERRAETREARDLLDWALDQLSPRDRMVLTLTYFEEYTVAEAAELLGWSVANAKVRAFRARRKLRKILQRAVPPARGVDS